MASETNNGLAIPLALVGNAINAVGYIIQKQAHTMNEAKLQAWMKEQRATAAGAREDDYTNGDETFPANNMVATRDYPSINCCCRQIPLNHFLVTPYWWCGLILYGVGSAIHGVALANGSHTIIAPMDAFTLVCNAIFAPLILKEVSSTKK